jgi:hypothetical protein
LLFEFNEFLTKGFDVYFELVNPCVFRADLKDGGFSDIYCFKFDIT